jgi:hypothetical protein
LRECGKPIDGRRARPFSNGVVNPDDHYVFATDTRANLVTVADIQKGRLTEAVTPTLGLNRNLQWTHNKSARIIVATRLAELLGVHLGCFLAWNPVDAAVPCKIWVSAHGIQRTIITPEWDGKRGGTDHDECYFNRMEKSFGFSVPFAVCDPMDDASILQVLDQLFWSFGYNAEELRLQNCLRLCRQQILGYANR